MRRSNIIAGIFNVIILLYAFVNPVVGMRQIVMISTPCDHTTQGLYAALGMILFIGIVAFIIGLYLEIRRLLWLTLVISILLILLMLISAIFFFAVTGKGGGESINGKAYKEYRLGDYSHYMQHIVSHGWKGKRGCSVDICQLALFDDKGLSATQFNSMKLSSIQSGCCKPSNDCGFTFVTPTNWTKPSTTTTYSNSDCALWDNNDSVLCYDCNACKAGVAESIKVAWRASAYFNIIILALLFIALVSLAFGLDVW